MSIISNVCWWLAHEGTMLWIRSLSYQQLNICVHAPIPIGVCLIFVNKKKKEKKNAIPGCSPSRNYSKLKNKISLLLMCIASMFRKGFKTWRFLLSFYLRKRTFFGLERETNSSELLQKWVFSSGVLKNLHKTKASFRYF